MEEFQPHNGIKWQGDVGVVQYGAGDSSLIVMFYVKPVLNKQRSQAEGRPYHEDKVFVTVHPPGERLNIVDREATESDKRRWPMQWAQFMQNKPQVSDGTPIEMLFPAQPSISAALQASGVHTVEQCAGLSAHAIETIGMGCQQWVNEATRYLQVANRGVKHSEMKKMVDDLENENRTLKHQLDLVMGELKSLRDLKTKAVTLDDVEKLIANQGGGGRRAVYPSTKQLGTSFDVQSDQISATHPTNDLAKSKVAKNIQAKRSRARINS